jgi:uncharacterized protein (TIGR00266 family)
MRTGQGYRPAMQISIRHNPSFAVGRCALAPNEQVRVESGAMMATSAGVALQSKMEGGVMKSLKRAALGGESLFVTTYTAPESGGWVDVAANLPGDLVAFDVQPQQALMIQRGSWLASSSGVEIETKFGGMGNLFGGEGGFVVRASGQGPVLVSCYGALNVYDLQPGEWFTLDTGHMVAYTEGVQTQIRKVASGIVQSAKSGEGLVFDFQGPGRVFAQTRNPSGLISWISSNRPGQRA